MSAAVRLLCLIIVIGMSLATCEPSMQDIRIAAQDFRFDPSEIRLSAARPVRLRIVNEGREIHEFGSPLLSDPQVHVRIEPPQNLPSNVRITPGRTATITLQAPPGTYLFRCVIRGHAGMTGTLIIEEARTAS